MKRFLKTVKRIMIVLLCLLLLLVIVGYFYMQQPQFGALPEGQRLERIKKSPHYTDGKFRNIVERPIITKGYSMIGQLYEALFTNYPRREPTTTLPSIKTDLKTLPADSNILVWFGHSSFYVQVDGIKILVDPVFSGKASPLPGGVRAYAGTDVYNAEDMPEIDYVLMSHDHYDHLDYETALALKSKVKHVICGLGVGAHYERWGYAPEQILELDWGENVNVKPGFTIYTEDSHHNCARGFTRDQALWVSFFIQAPSLKIYYSGDGGRDERFKNFNQKFGAIDWAIMECGQYNKAWQSVHELPEEVAQSTVELQAKNLLPVHHSKFTLAKHTWDEPLEEITRLSQSKPYRLATPIIGEPVRLSDSTQQFNKWWKGID